MFDSIHNVGDFLSPHWLSEAFPGRLKTLTRQWRERTEHGSGRHNPLRALARAGERFLRVRAAAPHPYDDGHTSSVAERHGLLVEALGFEAAPVELLTQRPGESVTVPLLARLAGPSGEALHVLQAEPVETGDDLFGLHGRLLFPLRRSDRGDHDRDGEISAVPTAVEALFRTEHAPRFVLVLAGGWMLLSDAAGWAEGRYLAFDMDTAFVRGDERTTGELAWIAGLVSADVLQPAADGTSLLTEFCADSVRHAAGASEDLRAGLRVSVELIANEVLERRRANGDPVDDCPELPRELTIQALRFLYRLVFLLHVESRPGRVALPVQAPEYEPGYGLDRLRELLRRPPTGTSRAGHHLHDSLRQLFLLVNEGHDMPGAYADDRDVAPLHCDLFDPRHTEHIDGVNLSNAVLQQVLTFLLLSGSVQDGHTGTEPASWPRWDIPRIGAVFEGLMAHDGFLAERDLVELAEDGDPAAGTRLVARQDLDEHNARRVASRRESRGGEEDLVAHRKGSFVYRLSEKDRQRSASGHTHEVLTSCVVRHALAELVTEDTPAEDILEFRVCDPAMGGGAFLNEAVNQLAEEYLRRRQVELGETIDPGEYRGELRKVKAHLALHRCHGVDLNDTARELSGVLLWLNVLHPGLPAPWFDQHLKRGNALIGARRATHHLTTLDQDKQNRLNTPPTERPLSAGAVPDGEIHHFLLPAAGWGAVADMKQAAERAPERVAEIREWARSVTRKPGRNQTTRLRGLSRRVERLWELSRRRMEASERALAHDIDVWGRQQPRQSTVVPRERVESELNDPDGPYRRLQLVMDAWCALFFWPVTTEITPPSLEQWLGMVEGLLGTGGRQSSTRPMDLPEPVEDFDELATLDRMEKAYFGMQDVETLYAEHPWLDVVHDISRREGFFHWELEFAPVFARGGFDLQLGDPPWTRSGWLDPRWFDRATLAEIDPSFVPWERVPERNFRKRRDGVLADPEAKQHYLDEWSRWAGHHAHLSSPTEHPDLPEVQIYFYTRFVERTWRSRRRSGIVGLLHPENHFTDPEAGKLREETYRRLRRHWQFVNEVGLVEDTDGRALYGVQIYGDPGEVDFVQASHLLAVDTLEGSLRHDGGGDVPGMRHPWGGRDLRPHSSRLVRITEQTLAQWAALFGDPGTPAIRTRLLRPLTREALHALGTLSRQDGYVVELNYRWDRGWDENKLRQGGYGVRRTEHPSSWRDAILQDRHFSVATPFAQEPNENCRDRKDYSDWNLEELPERVLPRTNYHRATDRTRYEAELAEWDGHPATDSYRLAWRRRTRSGLERSLTSALVPPGPAHVRSVHTLAAASNRRTVLLSGMWSSLPLDYLVKVSGASTVDRELVERFPAPLGHPAARLLLLRTLRLNCLTRDYAPLWAALYDPQFATDTWTSPFRGRPKLGVTEGEWTARTPLRSEFDRRAALVEIDALVAIMLGLTADQLCLMYRGQFAVLRKHEHTMYFDTLGRRIAKHQDAHGLGQEANDWKLLQAYLAEEDPGDLLERYEEPFTPVDREAEMRAAHADLGARPGVS